MPEWVDALIAAWSRQVDGIDMAELSEVQRAQTRLDHSYFPPAAAIALTLSMDDQIRVFYGRIGANLAGFQRQMWERLELAESIDDENRGVLDARRTAALMTRRRMVRGRATLVCAPRSMQIGKTIMAQQFFLSAQHRYAAAPEPISENLVRENPLNLVALPVLGMPVPHPLTPLQWGYSILGGIDELSNEGEPVHPSTLLKDEKKKFSTNRCAKGHLLQQLVLASVSTLVFYDFHSIHLGSHFLTDC
jgi:hypothetical protein